MYECFTGVVMDTGYETQLEADMGRGASADDCAPVSRRSGPHGQSGQRSCSSRISFIDAGAKHNEQSIIQLVII